MPVPKLAKIVEKRSARFEFLMMIDDWIGDWIDDWIGDWISWQTHLS